MTNAGVKTYGFVPTPDAIVDQMVSKLFAASAPSRDSSVLDPGCGPGAFISGVIRWCEHRSIVLPRIVGVELDPVRHAEATERFRRYKSISIKHRNFLDQQHKDRFDYVIGNPPYVPITKLSEKEKAVFRGEFTAASGRFDLYLLFFEQALRLLRDGGRLVFITPEKFLYVKTAQPLRRMLSALSVVELALVDEGTFADLVTYPTITTIDKSTPRETAVVLRDGSTFNIRLPIDGASLLPQLNGLASNSSSGPTLRDVCSRVSCGVATGADGIFVRSSRGLNGLSTFAYPTISGRQLVPGQENVRSEDVMLVPYDRNGSLVPLDQLGTLADYLSEPEQKHRLLGRVCARRKPWHAFHDSVPLDQILQPKLLCKDITESPGFWIDRCGTLIPRHSVYYIVPSDPTKLDELANYLNSSGARAWMRANCQRAANGFIRLQSEVLKHLPVPDHLLPKGGAYKTARALRRLKHAKLVLST